MSLPANVKFEPLAYLSPRMSSSDDLPQGILAHPAILHRSAPENKRNLPMAESRTDKVFLSSHPPEIIGDNRIPD